MKKLLLFLCLLAQTGVSQTQKIDSLKKELVHLQNQQKAYQTDTLTYNTVKALMSTYAEIDLDSSMYFNTLMIRLCTQPKLQRELIYAYQYAGYLNQLKGDYYTSIRFNYKALSLAEKLKEYTRMARSLATLAHAYSSIKGFKDYPKIQGFCQQGLRLLRKYPNPTTQLLIYNVLGTIYREQGKLADALKANQDMYKLAQHEYIQWYEAQGLQAIGWVYKEMGELTKALDYTKRALGVCIEKRLDDMNGRVDLKVNILANITDIYIRQKEWKQALTYCWQAKETAIRTNNSSVLAESEEQLYKIFKNTNEPAKALKAHENFVFLRDSLSKDTNEQRIESLQAQYDNVQKENVLQRQKVELLNHINRNQELIQRSNVLFLGIAIILLIAALLFWNNRRLDAKNTEIDRQRALLETARSELADININLEARVDERTKELVEANQELIRSNEKIKEALFKGQTIERKRVALELHDNLSSLLSAVNMSVQAINPENLSESEQSVYRNVKHLIQNAYVEVRNISHNILPAELEREGLATTLTTLIGKLNQNSPLKFFLTITNLQERLPIEIEFNVYSITFELINNAIRHAQASAIIISLFRSNIGIDLSVTDDGIGLEQQNAKRGVGLQNIQTRLESLGGTFTTLLPTEKGTRILIKIPIETTRFNGNEGIG